jgi:hypothetical protein
MKPLPIAVAGALALLSASPALAATVEAVPPGVTVTVTHPAPGWTAETIANRPIPDTPASRAMYPPLSRGGAETAPIGD